MTTQAGSSRYAPEALTGFAAALLTEAGLDADKSRAVAAVLVESDLLGHATHGLGLLPKYLDELRRGIMEKHGEPEVINDRGACVTWNGRMLPGQWLATRALDLALERVGTYGTVTVAVANSYHIGCLAAYLERATERGCMMILASSAPGAASVAPFGGRAGVFSPSPIAVGIPTDKDPVLVDISASITTNNMTNRLVREGRRFPYPWLLDAEGMPTDDPNALAAGGTILTAGGLDHGQKGYGYALLSEALTQGLSGHGRADGPAENMSACVTMQVIDPGAFAGRDAFARQTGHLAEACRNSPPRPGFDRVRLPGENGLKHRREAAANGVHLAAVIMDGLRAEAERTGIAMPEPLAQRGAA